MIFPPWQSVYYHFAKWRKAGLWRKLNKHLRRKLRKMLGRNQEPSAGCADSQSVKAGSLHANGYDGAKSVNGRKRHLLVDTLGLVLSVLVTSANIPERKGLSRLLQSRHTLPRLHHLWLDRGYKGVAFVKRILLCFGIVPGGKLRKLDIVARRNGKRFGLQARRWVVERTFAQVSIADAGHYVLNLWLGNYRRLSKDYETLPSSSEAFIYLASCDLMTKRLAKTNRTPWRKRKK